MSKFIQLPDPLLAVNPVGFADKRLGVPVKVLSVAKYGGTGMRLAGYAGGRFEIEVSDGIDLSSLLGRRMIWHEIAHLFDEVEIIGHRNNFHALAATGRYSSAARDVLKRHADFISCGKMPEAAVRMPAVRTKGVRARREIRPIEDVLRDESLPADRRRYFQLQYAAFKIQARRYLRQDAELFANGFGLWMTCPLAVLGMSTELAEVFSQVAGERGLNGVPTGLAGRNGAPDPLLC